MSPFRTQGRTPDPVDDVDDLVALEKLERRVLRSAARRLWMQERAWPAVRAVILLVVVASAAAFAWWSSQRDEDCRRRGGVFVRTPDGYQCVRVERLR